MEKSTEQDDFGEMRFTEKVKSYYTLEEIRLDKRCPEWLKADDIKVENEKMVLVHGIDDGVEFVEIFWLDGTWISGEYKGCFFQNGVWKGDTSEKSLRFLLDSTVKLYFCDDRIEIRTFSNF